MKVRAEIEKYSSEEDKPVLLWLLDRYHWESEWRIMACCDFVGRYPASHRVWKPQGTGTMLYEYAMMKEAPQEIADLKACLYRLIPYVAKAGNDGAYKGTALPISWKAAVAEAEDVLKKIERKRRKTNES